MKTRHAARSVALWIVTTLGFFSVQMSLASDHAEDGPDATPQAYVFNEYLVPQRRFTLPFQLIDGHILIEGAVNGRHGKFMFDTGTEFPFFLNGHLLPLSPDHLVARGRTGSGEALVLHRQDAPVARIEVADQIRFENLRGLLHADWGFLEEAYTPDFLGTIGHGFNRNYLFVIDYDARTIVFHALDQDEAALAKVMDPARVIATLHFRSTGVGGKMPEVDLRIGGEAITGVFDTGNPGTLDLTEAMKNALEARGNLVLVTAGAAPGIDETPMSGSLGGLSHGALGLHDVHDLIVRIGAINRLGLGYQFLRNYVTAWDYRRQTLTLLKR